MKKLNGCLLILSIFILFSCEKEVMELEEEKGDAGQEFIYVPPKYRELMQELKKNNPEAKYHFRMIPERLIFKEINMIKDESENELLYQDQMSEEDIQWMNRRRIRFLDDNLKKSGKNKRVDPSSMTYKRDMIAVIYRSSMHANVPFPDVHIYDKIHELPYPWDGMEGFYQKMAEAIKWPEHFNFNCDTEVVTIETVITSRGIPVYTKLNQGIILDDKDLQDKVNGAIFKAFMHVSSERGWRPARKGGKKVFTKTVLDIPLKDLK